MDGVGGTAHVIQKKHGGCRGRVEAGLGDGPSGCTADVGVEWRLGGPVEHARGPAGGGVEQGVVVQVLCTSPTKV